MSLSRKEVALLTGIEAPQLTIHELYPEEVELLIDHIEHKVYYDPDEIPFKSPRASQMANFLDWSYEVDAMCWRIKASKAFVKELKESGLVPATPEPVAARYVDDNAFGMF